MPLEAVFFDVGNTLIHEVPSRYAIYAHVARSHGREIDPDAMRRLMGRVHHELPDVVEGGYRYSDPWFRAFVRRIFGDELGLEAERVDQVTEELFARFEAAATFHLFPGAREVLAELRERGLVLGIVSNWSSRLPRLLRALELESAFDFVLCSADEGIEKPDRRIFQRAVERAGRLDPEACAHAGDDVDKDVRGAYRAGLTPFLVDHLGTVLAPEDAAAVRVRGLGELRDRILERLT